MRKLFAVLALCLVFASPVMANSVAKKYVPNAAQVGLGRLSIAFWDVYDATLYAPNGQWDARKPHALSIHYFREIEGVDIAKRSVEEIRKQGFTDAAKLAEWQTQMLGIFPDVKNGSVLTAVFTAQKSTVFYAGGKKIGSIKDAEFSKRFFDIWLSEKTSEPALRKKLLGLS
jgi:hypothetical protein